MQIRVARPTARLDETAAFYRDLVGLPVLASFADHDGFSGVILGVPDATHQLELVEQQDVRPTPTSEDQLVLYLGSPAEVARVAGRIERAGVAPSAPANPYWEHDGARCFVDPDGYWLVLSPSEW